MSAELNTAVEAIRSATKGLGTDEKKLIESIVRLPLNLIPQLSAHYKSNYGKSLDDVLKNEVSGNFGKLLRICVQEEVHCAARTLKKAFDGIGCDVKMLGETLIGRTNGEVNAIKASYKAQFNEDLEKRLVSETKGDVEKFFVILIQAGRDEACQVTTVDADVETLYKAGEGKFGTNETEFIRLFLNRHPRHLVNVFKAYAQKYEHTMAKVVKKEFSGKLEDLLLAVVLYIEDWGTYFAELLESSMAGIGTDDDKLSRLVVRVRRVGAMSHVKESYMKKYGKSLDKRIKGETSGDYLKLLLALVELPE